MPGSSSTSPATAVVPEKLIDRAARPPAIAPSFSPSDVPEVGRRPRELRRGFKMPFKIGPRQVHRLCAAPPLVALDLDQGPPRTRELYRPRQRCLRSATESRASRGLGQPRRIPRPVARKAGGQGRAHALTTRCGLKAAGVDAVQVSSHGGRQLDSAPPAILMLSEKSAKPSAKDFPLFYDSQAFAPARTWSKPMPWALNFVFFGRSMQFATAAGGETGLAQLWDVLSDETSLTLAQLGRTSMRSHSPRTIAS